MKTFDKLFTELSRNAAERPAGSGTVAALDAGVHSIGKKVVEEAAEVWMAAEHESVERAHSHGGLSHLATAASIGLAGQSMGRVISARGTVTPSGSGSS